MHILIAKKGQKKKKYSPEFKIGVILDMRENRLGYRETVRKYWEDSKGKKSNHIKKFRVWNAYTWKKKPKGL